MPEREVRILIIDDDFLVPERIKAALGFLRPEGLDWTIAAYASSGKGALEAINMGRKLGITHVLLDANLGIDDPEGFNIARELLVKFPHIYIIGISASFQYEMDPNNRVPIGSRYVDLYVGKKIMDRNVFRQAIESSFLQR